jgi:hypothetical protein
LARTHYQFKKRQKEIAKKKKKEAKRQRKLEKKELSNQEEATPAPDEPETL